MTSIDDGEHFKRQLLQSLLAFQENSQALPAPPKRGMGMAGALALGLATIAAALIVIVPGSSSTGSHPRTTTSVPPANPAAASTGPEGAAATMRLADYRLQLPQGFRADAAPCALPGAEGGAPPMASASGSAGGCLQASLLSGAAVPDQLRPTAVGPYAAAVGTLAGTATLYVQIPSGTADRELVLRATGIEAAELVRLAAASLPKSIETSPCSADCG